MAASAAESRNSQARRRAGRDALWQQRDAAPHRRPLHRSPVAASTLNDVFDQPAPEPPPSSNFVVGDPLGTFSMTVQAR